MTDWRTAYFIGGGLGLLLLALRLGTSESSMFLKVEKSRRASLGLLLRSHRLLGRYLCCVLTAIPIWCVVAVFITIAPEMAQKLEVTGPVSAGSAVFYLYAGASLGDFLACWASQRWRTRKRIILICLVCLSILTASLLTLRGLTPQGMLTILFAQGLATGYWGVFVTMTAEQFGTNVRSTATTTAPNVVRGTVVLINAVFTPLRGWLGLVGGAAIVCTLWFGAAALALSRLPETFGKELDYLE